MIRFRYVIAPLTGLFAALLLGCADDISGVPGLPQPYSIYGILNPESDTQWVWVFPIEDRFEPANVQPFDARFTSTDLVSGVREVWQDSVLESRDGLLVYVYYLPSRVRYGRTYHLEAERADGARSSVVTTVPPQAELVVLEPDPPHTSPLRVEGDVPRLNKVEVEYYVQYRPGPVDSSSTLRMTFSYNGEQEPAAGGWVIPVNLKEDYHWIVTHLDNTGRFNPDIILLEMTLRLIAASEEWEPPGGILDPTVVEIEPKPYPEWEPPRGSFDPEVLMHPGLMSNVDNGFGFVGAGFRLERRWLPAAAVLEAAGFWTGPVE